MCTRKLWRLRSWLTSVNSAAGRVQRRFKMRSKRWRVPEAVIQRNTNKPLSAIAPTIAEENFWVPHAVPRMITAST